VGWFVFFGLLAELLAVSLTDENQGEITPSAPIYWAAACVLNPALSIAVCLASSVFADLIALLAFLFVRRKSLVQQNSQGLLVKMSSSWEHRFQIGATKAIEIFLAYPSALVLMVGLSSLSYHQFGGHFLVSGMPSNPLANFIFPFFCLAAVAICVDSFLYAVGIVIYDPLPGAKGIRGFLLRMQLELIATVLPLARAQSFLVIVSLMLAYLYVKMGPLGFVLTSLPVVALRDFYSHWVRQQSAYLDTITTLATYMQHYHPYTRGHLKRVAELSERLARELRLPAESIRHISHAGLLHDIGKIAVSEEILDKTSKLEPEEWERIKSHPVAGAEIISHLDFLEGVVDWIKYHHKWHDGRGYPESNGDKIPIEASIIAVADSFDAMTDDRELSLEWVCDSCGYRPVENGRPNACPKCGATKSRTYRTPKTLDQAIDELRRGSGTQFHPIVVKAFLSMLARDGVHID